MSKTPTEKPTKSLARQIATAFDKLEAMKAQTDSVVEAAKVKHNSKIDAYLATLPADVTAGLKALHSVI